MDCFKLKPGANLIFPVTQGDHMLETQKKPPYYIQDKNGGEHYYAVCPECDNPIQLIGLFQDTVEAGRKPYGRHYKGNIPGLAKYSEEDYLDCSYSNPRWKKPYARRNPSSKLAKEALRLMYEQYDRVIYVLSKDMQIQISRPMARKLLEYFVNHKAWRYRTATLNNLPWILAETAPSMALYGQWILRGSELHGAIEQSCPAALFVETASEHYIQLKQRQGMYLDVRFFFMGHEKEVDAEGQHLEESIVLKVTSEKQYIYSKTIQIRTDYFLNLIHLPEARSRRNEGYLEIARALIDPKLFESLI